MEPLSLILILACGASLIACLATTPRRICARVRTGKPGSRLPVGTSWRATFHRDF